MSAIELDESQNAAVQVGHDDRQIVIAGPGAGKTEVVSALVQHLVAEEDVDPTDGILVISFSNAAVHAVESRLRANNLGPVSVQTMDSLAGEILAATDGVDVEGLTFDKRIALATGLLRDDSSAGERFEDIEHLVVDEVQDVVGVRAEFLLAIIECLPEDAGLSLFGDPAQGIYDFQLRPAASGRKPLSTMTSQDLLHHVSRMEGVVTKELTGQYRASSRDARAAANLRSDVLDGGRFTAVNDFEAALVNAGTIEQVVHLARRWPGRTAFLTDNNGQAMLVADEIAKAGSPVEVRRGVQQRVLSSWIAGLLADSRTPTVRRDELDALIVERSPDLDPAEIWWVLRSTAGSRGTEVEISRLAQRLRAPRALLPQLLDEPAAPFVVSTVHRAKGLEFDNVVLVDFPDKPWIEDETDDFDYARTRFVALTRARQLVVRSHGPDDRWLSKFSKYGLHSTRWYIRGRKDYQTFGYEFRVDDIERREPGGKDPEAAQERLAVVRPGEPLTFVLDPRTSTLRLPVYDILHGGVSVARTSVAFGEDLVRRIGTIEKKKSGWPSLGGARVESVATVAGDPQRDGVGRRGLWLVPVTTGILRIDWKGGDDA